LDFDQWSPLVEHPTLVRKTFGRVGAGDPGLLLLGCALAGPTISVILLLLAFAAGGIAGPISGRFANTAGPRMAAADGLAEFPRKTGASSLRQ